jgi:hypothetical protein
MQTGGGSTDAMSITDANAGRAFNALRRVADARLAGENKFNVL